MTATNVLGRLTTLVVTAAAIYCLSYWTCAYTLCLTEDMGTMYYDWLIVVPLLARPGGAAHVGGLLLTQLMVSPAVAAGVLTALLTLVAWLMYRLLRGIASSLLLTPLALAPSLTLALMQCDVNYDLGGTVALTLALVAALGYVRLCRVGHRRALVASVAYALAVPAALSPLGGGAAMLLALIIAMVTMSRDPRRGLWALLCPLEVWGLGYVAVLMGCSADVARMVTPVGYYSGWLSAPASLWLPWAAVLVAVGASCVMARVPRPGRRGAIATVATTLCVVAIVTWRSAVSLADTPTQRLHHLVYLAGEGRWGDIKRLCRTLPQDDPRVQNILHMAQARTAELCSRLFHSPDVSMASLIDNTGRSPVNYTILSDIYYTMGHMALARQYAFDANEAMDNLSPRLLMRLADTNIVYGQYEVARRYLRLLSRTLAYREWARRRLELTRDDAAVSADPELGTLRRCLMVEDRFAGVHGVEDDLRQIVEANPCHRPAMQYLGAMVMLSRDVPRLTELIGRYYGTEALPYPLPVHFQEAMAMATFATGQDLNVRYQLPPEMMNRCRRFWQQHAPQPNTYWSYLRRR